MMKGKCLHCNKTAFEIFKIVLIIQNSYPGHYFKDMICKTIEHMVLLFYDLEQGKKIPDMKVTTTNVASFKFL